MSTAAALTPTLTMPDIAPDIDTLSAALAYATAGIYVGPTQAGKKYPHPELGKQWQDKTSRDPEQITAWFAGTDHGVFIHAGASGLLIFDVDHPDYLHPAIERAIADYQPPFQSTRANVEGQGHYVFAVPDGRTFGSGTGQLGGGWGDVRGGNSLIVAAPSVHALAADGGRYEWLRTGPVPMLPEYLCELLTAPRSAASPEVQTVTYDALSGHQQGEASRYLGAVVSGWRDDLTAAANWPEGQRDQNARGWEKLVSDVCHRLGSLARADWTPWTLDDAWRAVESIVPAPMAGAVPLAHKWASQCERGEPAAMPERLADDWSGTVLSGLPAASSVDGSAGVPVTSPHVSQDHAAMPDVPAVTVQQALDVVTLSDVVLCRVRYLWDGRVPLGAMTLMPGEEGIGKTTIGARLVADVTRGQLAGEWHGTPRDVILIGVEDGLADVAAPRLRFAGADPNRVHVIRARFGADGDSHGIIIPRDLDQIGALVRERQAAMVYIDSLVTTLPDDMKSISYKDTAKVLKALGEFAEAHSVAVIAPWHLNKQSGGDTAVRMMDSRAYRTAVRSVLLVVPDPDAPEGHTQGIVALDKANAGTLNVPGLIYRIRSARYVVAETDPLTGEVTDHATSCGVAEWIGTVDGDARAVARAALTPVIAQQGGPVQWLRDHLASNGETARMDVIAAAEEEGYSESAIKRASRSLRVVSQPRTGQKANGQPFHHAVWTLPVQSGHPSGLTDPAGQPGPTGEVRNGLDDP